ncbi:hypothetical protein DFH29DRAFT_420319 [Suillus ampliporus]|nr:hypothetical protein DFH29DRAFT_420319 [Suillus ampliporus]
MMETSLFHLLILIYHCPVWALPNRPTLHALGGSFDASSSNADSNNTHSWPCLETLSRSVQGGGTTRLNGCMAFMHQGI